MPGTGHFYEIANAGYVRSMLAGYGAESGCEEGVRWFASRHLLKDLTQERFVRSAVSSDIGDLDIRTAGCDPLVVGNVFRAGRDVRVFDPDTSRLALTQAGYDLSHFADWFRSLSAAGDPLLAKTGRMRIRDVAVRAAAWTKALADKQAGRGTVEDVMVLDNGSRWTRLLDAEALTDELARMHHCTGSLGSSLQDFMFLSLRDPTGRSVLTARLKPGRNGTGPSLSEMKAFANRPASFEHAGAVLAMFRHLDIRPEAAFSSDVFPLMLEHDDTCWRMPDEFPEGTEGGRRVFVGTHSVFVPGADGRIAGRIGRGNASSKPACTGFLEIRTGCGADDLAACLDIANSLGVCRTNSGLVDVEDDRLVY